LAVGADNPFPTRVGRPKENSLGLLDNAIRLHCVCDNPSVAILPRLLFQKVDLKSFHFRSGTFRSGTFTAHIGGHLCQLF
jgi:hypothetical protein